MSLNLEALWDKAVREAENEANCCYPEDCKEKRDYKERLISKYYNQMVNVYA